MPGRAFGRFEVGTRLVLLAAFGGVLGLMALAGLDTIRALHRIETENTRITREYLKEHHFLEQVRSALYLSTTFIRDYLLETDPNAARVSLEGLRQLQKQMDGAIRAYSASVRPDERSLLSELQMEVGGYWAALTPAMRWGPEERRARGYEYLQTQVVPRRTLTLGIADKIDAVNEQALSTGNQRSARLFADYRRRVTAILGLTLGIGLVLASASIVRILRLEKESGARYRQLQRAQDELKRLSARLVEAQEQERRTISRELHDEVGQSLNALLVDLGNLAAVTAPDNEEAGRLLQTAKRLADESVKSVRNMALLLRPSMLDDFGLVPALHWQAREVSRRTGMRIDVDAEEVADTLPDEHRTCVYRVVQEALQNASRHAEAQTVRISVRQNPDGIVLTVRDDGKGFDATRVRGLGLLGMEERAKHLGGAFEIRSQPGGGSELRIELPLPERAGAAEVA